MSPETLAITMFFTLFVGLLLGHPGLHPRVLALIFGVIGWGGSMDAVMALLVNRAYGVMEEYVLVAVPLFIFMAQLLDASGIAERLFETMHIVMGRLRAAWASPSSSPAPSSRPRPASWARPKCPSACWPSRL